MYGFYGRILKIDLSAKRYFIEKIEYNILKKYLGGRGLGSYLLYNLNPPEISALDPANCLIFATGPITNGLVWGSSRYGVFTKSPQTGFYSESYSGGKTPEAIDSTGFDAIIIYGKSSIPIVVSIHPERVEFYQANDLWGIGTYETEDIVIKEFAKSYSGSNRIGAVVIGPAGENLVCFSVIENDHWRSAGRTGVGAVMGSKKLKAIIFQGNKQRELFDENGIKDLYKTMAMEARENPGVGAYKSFGTPMMVDILNEIGAFPTKYWSEGRVNHWEKINAQALHKKCKIKPHACPKCFMSCGRMSEVIQGPRKGLKLIGPEYETIYAFGGLCLVDDICEIAYLNDICDHLGMDTISAGNLCSLTIEAARLGKIDYKIDYNDVDGLADLLYKIAKREDIGDILAKGIRYAANIWGMEDIAIHVKGLEPAGYDPRVLKGMALAYATSPRGALSSEIYLLQGRIKWNDSP